MIRRKCPRVYCMAYCIAVQHHPSIQLLACDVNQSTFVFMHLCGDQVLAVWCTPSKAVMSAYKYCSPSSPQIRSATDSSCQVGFTAFTHIPTTFTIIAGNASARNLLQQVHNYIAYIGRGMGGGGVNRTLIQLLHSSRQHAQLSTPAYCTPT